MRRAAVELGPTRTEHEGTIKVPQTRSEGSRNANGGTIWKAQPVMLNCSVQGRYAFFCCINFFFSRAGSGVRPRKMLSPTWGSLLDLPPATPKCAPCPCLSHSPSCILADWLLPFAKAVFDSEVSRLETPRNRTAECSVGKRFHPSNPLSLARMMHQPKERRPTCFYGRAAMVLTRAVQQPSSRRCTS